MAIVGGQSEDGDEPRGMGLAFLAMKADTQNQPVAGQCELCEWDGGIEARGGVPIARESAVS